MGSPPAIIHVAVADMDATYGASVVAESNTFKKNPYNSYTNATDRNKDGIITEEEYVENRTITDEAKEIFNKMDENRDGIVTEQEFIDNSEILNHDLAQKIFRQLDINGEGQLSLPAYLRVWGNWARED